MGNNITYIEQNGFRIYIRLDRSYQDVKIINEVISGDVYQVEELAHLLQNNPPKVILDTGGHIGTFGLLCKRFWPDAFLIAFEPTKESAWLYRLNMNENGFTGYSVNKKAVSYDPECTCLLEAARTTGGAILCSPESASDLAHRHFREYNVIRNHLTTTTIEKVIKDYDLTQIDLAKWDCEGSEIKAFENMSPEAASVFRYMVGEYHINVPYLRASPIDWINFRKMTKRKFPHLFWNYEIIGDSGLGYFQAWPKELSNVDIIGNKGSSPGELAERVSRKRYN